MHRVNCASFSCNWIRTLFDELRILTINLSMSCCRVVYDRHRMRNNCIANSFIAEGNHYLLCTIINVCGNGVHSEHSYSCRRIASSYILFSFSHRYLLNWCLLGVRSARICSFHKWTTAAAAATTMVVPTSNHFSFRSNLFICFAWSAMWFIAIGTHRFMFDIKSN